MKKCRERKYTAFHYNLTSENVGKSYVDTDDRTGMFFSIFFSRSNKQEKTLISLTKRVMIVDRI